MISQRLKELRKSNNMTQSQLAKVLNVTTGAIGLWETGKRVPDSNFLLTISTYFGVSVDYLLGKDDENQVAIMGRNGSYKIFCLDEKDLLLIENLAESLGKGLNEKERN